MDLADNLAEKYLILEEPKGLGERGRYSQVWVWEQSDITLREFKDNAGFVSLEVRGSACDRLGLDGVSWLLNVLPGYCDRWQASRIDGAFDGVRAAPRAFFDAVDHGNTNSRCKLYPNWDTSPTGTTCYVYSGADLGKAPRHLCVYDARGFTRCEFRSKREHARALGDEISLHPVTSWASIVGGAMRAFVDFVDVSASDRPDRAPLLPWWSELVGDFDKLRITRPGDGPPVDQGDYQFACRRLGHAYVLAKTCAKLVDAYGLPWFVDHLMEQARGRYTDDDLREIERLKAARPWGIQGVQAPKLTERSDDDIPF